ncbi:histidine kinase dimerization/phosphoacceptor domain -containing protein [Methanococcoides sp. AM1]|uniref:PAS domain-containing sensor histidine kinase n=1 Tax=Methanococcoides sp. AM1 TaxID=1201011 RepID=UPI0010825DDD|nr:histidine kinase dimerization/phosphoacceptor domain -containing protein [Methanococcoides sp. AM1]
MNDENLKYDELKARYNELQKQVTRFSAIEQKLVNTGDHLDQELGRFKSIQSHNKKAIRIENLHDLLLITVESIVEVFEVECGAFFTYDMTNNRLTLVENYGFDEKHPFVMDWIISDNIVNTREGVFIEDSGPSNPWESLGLCQVIYAPYYKDGDLQGFVLGGRSTKKKDFYDKIGDELRPSFMVFVQQMSALLHNLESQEIIRQNVSELTSTNKHLQQEIIQRKHAEEVLQENENKLKTVLASIQTGVVIIDAETHTIIDANLFAVQIIGAPKEEIVGKVCHEFICTAEERKCPISDLKMNIDKSERVLLNVRGEEIPVLKTVASVNLDGRLHFIESFIDITEHKKAEEVRKKDTLLKEIHHRVKNNLQVISSLLNLQSRNFNDEKVIDAFRESQSRVRSMAIAHQKLYQSKDLASIDIGDYIKKLTTYLFQTYRIGNSAIKLKLDIDNVYMGIERTIPLGLIINEIVSNSLKYAYQAEEEGVINIKFHLENKMFTLIISDTGIGIPKDLDYRNSHSLGLQLVTTLVKQIHGEIELDRSKGTKFVITFEE